MLIRKRKSRIYFLRQFFDYPIRLSADTLKKLGLVRTVKIGVSYTQSSISQVKPERTLEQFLVNRFGRELYLTFFKSYTEKVWGVPCDQISAEWGAQRIKGLSVVSAIKHFLKSAMAKKTSDSDISQKGTETSLIEKFMYPKLGPGQLWEYVAEDVKGKGGEVRTNCNVVRLLTEKATAWWRRKWRMPPPVHAKTIAAGLFLLHHANQGADARPRRAGARQRSRSKRRPDLSRLHHRRPAADETEDQRRYATAASSCWPTTGSIFRNRTWWWGACRSSITGAPIWWQTRKEVWIGLEYFCYDTDPIWQRLCPMLK